MAFPHLQELAAAQNSNSLTEAMSVYIEGKINEDLCFAAGLSHLWEVLYIRVNEHRLLIAELNVFGGPLALQCAEFFKQLSHRKARKTQARETSSPQLKVLTNDDLLTQILIRLPILCIHLFATVSKQWLRIITSPLFIKNRSQITKVDPPVGLFVSHKRSLFESDFVSLDPRLKSKKSAMDRSFTLGSTEEADNVKILQSCNGLLLCGGSGLPIFYYVYNPSTNQYKKLPYPDCSLDNSPYYSSAGLRIAFDPTKSSDYKVNDALHWLETENRHLTHYKLNIKDHEHPIITTIQIPQGLQQGRNFFESYGNMLPMIIGIQIPHMLHLEGKLFESRGCLVLVRRDYIGSSEFTIYEMTKGCYMWSIKYIVDIDDFMTPLPEGWSIRYIVWSLVLGEREVDSFFVMNLSGKVVQYNLISKTLREIYDMGSNKVADDYLHGFIPPFAMYDMGYKKVDNKHSLKAIIHAVTFKVKSTDSPSYSSSTYTAPSNSKTGSHRSGNVIKDVLQSFVADTEPEQQLAYEDFEQIEKMDLEEMDLKWQMAMLSVRVHKFEQKARRKIDFDKKESARFNKKKVRCYKCLQRGHFARECRAKGGNDKQRYSSFKIQEIGKKEEDSKALITVDTLVDWTEHDGQSDGVIAPKVLIGADTKEAMYSSGQVLFPEVNSNDLSPSVISSVNYLHLIKDCNYYETQYANDFDGVGYPQREPIWDNATRVTQSNQFVPQAVLLRSGKVFISAARPNQVPAEEEMSASQRETRQEEVLSSAKHYSDADLIDIMAQVHANAGLSSKLLGADVNDDNFAERMVALINQRKRAFAAQMAKEKRDKPMTPAQQREYMRQLIDDFEKIRMAVADLKSNELKRTLKRAGEALEPDTLKKQKSTEAPIPSVPDVPQPQVVFSSKSSGTRRKSLGRSHITKPKSILTELDLDADDKTFIKVVSVSLNFIESIKEARSRVQDLTSGEIV
ncbi:ribonuclease H-like domain-containing protein, partial [Tanacetum coccineum]